MPGKSRRVFLNDNILSHTMQRGIARYFRHVTDGVIVRFGSDVTICSPEVRDYGPASYIPSLRFRGAGRIGLHDKLASVAAYVERPSVFFSPYYGDARTKAAEVFTAYDMINELFPRYFPPQQAHFRRFIAQKKRCLERAAVVIAISENTARDIVAIYPQLASDIRVIYPGVDSFFFDGEDRDSGHEEKPFFLYVGHRLFYKNFTRLIMAFGESGLADDFGLKVISPSGDGFLAEEVDCIQRYHLEKNVSLLTGATDTAVRASYKRAVALVYPSEYEGFGLPILEAMASGTVVATSNVSSMPEVGANVALYFDPWCTESIADCLRRVVNLSWNERRERIVRGTALAHTFTWERCQQQTVEVLERLL